MKLKEKLIGLFSQNCYQSIDELPIYYWHKIHEENNLSYLVKTKNVYLNKKKIGLLKQYALSKLWRKMYDEYISRFGFGEIFLDIIRKEKEIALYQIDKIITGDETLQVFIDLCKIELANMQKQMIGGDFWELKAQIERAMGFTIDPLRVSVSEFYSYIKILEKETKNTKSNG